MARSRLSYHTNIDRRYLYDKEYGDILSITKTVNKRLSSMLKILDDAETFLAATKKYVRISKTVIASLRYCTVFLEEELEASNETIFEAERTIASLKSKIDLDFQFNRSHGHKSFRARKTASNGQEGNRRRHNASKRFNGNVSKISPVMKTDSIPPISLAETRRRNSKSYPGAKNLKSKTISEVSNSDYRPIDIRSLKNGPKYPESDLVFPNYVYSCNQNDSRKIHNGETSCETDDLFVRKISKNETSSDSSDSEVYENSENRSDFSSYVKDDYGNFFHRNTDKYNLCQSEIDDLSSRKAFRNPEMSSTLSSDDEVDVCSTEAVLDSSGTDGEFLKKCQYLKSINQTEDSDSESGKNLVPESPSSNVVQNGITSVTTTQWPDIQIAKSEPNLLDEGFSDNCLDRHLPFSDKEFSEFFDIQALPQKENLNNKSGENWFDAVESLKGILLQNIRSKVSSKQSDKNYSSTSIYENNLVTPNTSNHLPEENLESLYDEVDCSEGTTTSDSSWNSNWNGQTLIINSTKLSVKEINGEFKFKESLDKSPNNTRFVTDKEESSNYISLNSSCSSNKTAYFSVPKETLTEHLAEEKFYSFNSNTSSCTFSDTPPDDTTDTSVYDYSSDAQEDNKLCSSARESSDTSVCDESSDFHQIKNSSSMSLTEISSNTSMFENSNSFQFRSDSSKNEDSSLNAYTSSFSMSKEFSSLFEADISYEEFSEGIPPESLDSYLDELCNASLEVNVSQPFEDRHLSIDSSDVVIMDVSKYSTECNDHEENDEFDALTSMLNETSYDTPKQDLSETEYNLTKSRSPEILESASANEVTECLPFVKLDSFGRYEADIMKCAFRRAKSYGGLKIFKGSFYSKNVKALIYNNHCIM